MKKFILTITVSLFAFNAFASEWSPNQVNATAEMGRAFESLSFAVKNIPESKLGNSKLSMALDNALGNLMLSMNDGITKEERQEALELAFESTLDAKNNFTTNSTIEMALDDAAGSIFAAKSAISNK